MQLFIPLYIDVINKKINVAVLTQNKNWCTRVGGHLLCVRQNHCIPLCGI